MYMGRWGAEPGRSPSQKGAALTAQKHLAWGRGQGKGLPPPSLNSFPSQTGPLFVWCGGGQREREQRLPLGPMEKGKGLAEGKSFSRL